MLRKDGLKTVVLTAIYVCAAVAGAAERSAAWAVKIERAGLPNLHRVDAKLYRSAQPTAEGMTNLVALGVKTVVNLRDNHSDSDEIGALPLTAKRIEIFTGNPKVEQVKAFLAILDDTNAVPLRRKRSCVRWARPVGMC